MHSLLMLPVAAALAGAGEPPAAAPGPQPAIREIGPLTLSPEQCRDRITQVREATGRPPLLDRETTSPDRPYRIYAVDTRVNGCAVMVMHGDVSDIRPLPARPEGPVLLMPARPGQ